VVTVTGTGFTDSSTISTTTFDGNGRTMTPAHQTTTGAGAITAPGFTFVVPTSTNGAKAVVVTDASSVSASANFTVNSAITLGSGGLGKVGDTITVTGSGFIGSHALTASLGATVITLLPTSASDGTGSYSGHFVVPAKQSDGNPYTFTVTDGTNPATADFSIVAAISLAPAFGAVGNTSTVTGSGFIYAAGFQPITLLTFDSIDILNHGSPPVVAANGSWSQVFTVPADSAGIKSVVADDASGEGAPSANYTVLPELFITPSHATVGTAGIAISGTGFTNGDAITAITVGGVVPTTETCTAQHVAANGSWSGTFTIPAVPSGSQSVAITDLDDGTVDTSMTIDPKIVVTPSHAIVGTAGITVTGSGFTAGDHIMTFTEGGITPPVNTCFGALVAVDGSWSGTFTQPAIIGGINVLTAAEIHDTASVNFTTDPAISLTPSNGHVGLTGVVVTGSGFGNTQAVSTFHFNGVTPATQTVTAQTTSAVGAFTGTFTVPAAAAGAEPVFAQDASGKNASVNFTVTPKITLIPSATGHVATTITVQGTGFTAAEHISAFTFDGVTPPINTILGGGGALVGATGNWSGTFVVPAHAKATVVVAATDGSEGPINTPFSVTPAISLNPTSGLEGIIVTVTGSGFTNPSTIHTLTIGGKIPADDTCIGQLVAADGSWAGTFRVPPLPGGAQIVIATSNAVPPDLASVFFNESTTVVGTEMVTEDVLDSNGDVMWTVTHALSGVRLDTAPAFQDEKVVEYDNSNGATDIETMQVEETSDATSPGSKTTKKIVVQHST
jgi:hypothetical protein